MRYFKITFNSPVILGVSFVSLIVMAFNYNTMGKSNGWVFMTWHSSLRSPLTYLRFFTHVLGHSGWSHYIGNMSHILLHGPGLEKRYGARKLLGGIG